jgi:hypothetical protein
MDVLCQYNSEIYHLPFSSQASTSFIALTFIKLTFRTSFAYFSAFCVTRRS